MNFLRSILQCRLSVCCFMMVAGEDLRCIPWYELQERVDTKSQMKEIEESGDLVFIQYVDIPLYRWQDSGERLFNAEDRITLSTRVDRFFPAEYLVILPDYDVFRVKEQLLNKLRRAGSEKASGRNSRIYVESLFAEALKWLQCKALGRDDPLHDMMSSSDFKVVVQNAIRTVHRIPLKYDLSLSHNNAPSSNLFGAPQVYTQQLQELKQILQGCYPGAISFSRQTGVAQGVQCVNFMMSTRIAFKRHAFNHHRSRNLQLFFKPRQTRI